MMFWFGGPRGPRGGFSIFPFFLFLFIFGGIIQDLIGLVFALLPLAITGFIVYSVVNTLTNPRAKKVKRPIHDAVNNKKASDGISNADLSRIDKKLTEYFKKNVSLPIIEESSLVTNGSYTGIDSLYITYKDEKLCKLGDYKDSYPDIYNRIVKLLVAFSKQPDSVMETKVEVPKVNKEAVLSDAQKYIKKIDSLNAQIPQEEITNGLYQTCDLLNKIDLSDMKGSNYDKAKLTKLYDYYLPILTGILENYKKLQDTGIKNDEFKNSEAQLIKTIILINQALKTIYSELHEDDYLNINADINTLQTLLKKDGYDNNPFKKDE